MSSWLVTGAGGLLGHDIVLRASEAGHRVRGTSHAELDVTDLPSALDAVRGFDVVINCAAWTDVDGAEEHEGEAFVVNAVGAANLARACEAASAVMVQVSTDYVFSGGTTEPYHVGAPLCPINAYGRTKAASEWAVRSECSRHYVVRTSWLYGASGQNFLKSILEKSASKHPVQVVCDQIGSPTWTMDVAAFLLRLLELEEPSGVYHATAQGSTSWFGLAQALYEDHGMDPGRVQAISSRVHPRPARRPSYSVLSPTAVGRVGDSGFEMPHWRASVAKFIRELHTQIHGAV